MPKAMMNLQTMMRRQMNLNSLMTSRRLSTNDHYGQQKGRLIGSMTLKSLLAIRRGGSPEMLDSEMTCHLGSTIHRHVVNNHTVVLTAQIWLLLLLTAQLIEWVLKTSLWVHHQGTYHLGSMMNPHQITDHSIVFLGQIWFIVTA
jgi:hypothetical protein